jgi:hypothetical protein
MGIWNPNIVFNQIDLGCALLFCKFMINKHISILSLQLYGNVQQRFECLSKFFQHTDEPRYFEWFRKTTIVVLGQPSFKSPFVNISLFCYFERCLWCYSLISRNALVLIRKSRFFLPQNCWWFHFFLTVEMLDYSLIF